MMINNYNHNNKRMLFIYYDYIIPLLQVVIDASDTKVNPDFVYVDLNEVPNILTNGNTLLIILTPADSVVHASRKLHIVILIV